MKPFIACCAALVLAVAAEARTYTGRVFVDNNGNGRLDSGEKTLKNVKVSDGLNVTETDKNGYFSLPGHERQRFIFITTPSGYKTNNRHYIRIGSETDSYDFALESYTPRIGKGGAHSYIHISDTEIFNTTDNERWTDNLKTFARGQQTAFIVHTGDICYEKGLKEHIRLMNTDNMGVPVFYAIGNHDLVKGKYGEELFESLYGPVYYSFEVGNTHYIVTPMPNGDYRPDYTGNDVCNWLKNDLAHVKPGMAVQVFNHDLPTYGNDFIYKGTDNNSVDLGQYNLKAWIYGHWHINHIKKQGNVLTICTSSLDKGGIDHATTGYRVVHVDSKGDLTSELRYTYIDRHVHIASPAPFSATRTLTVNTYSSVARATAVTCSCTDADGHRLFKNRPLTAATDWSWSTELPLKPTDGGKSLTVHVEAHFDNGQTARAEQTFVYSPSDTPLRYGADWTNLLGNPEHAGRQTGTLTLPLRLAWTVNLGANVLMTSPLIHNGKVFTATMDEDYQGRAALYALDGQTGRIQWKYNVGNSIKNTIAITANTLFAQDVEGRLYALDTESGILRWQVSLPVNGLPALIDGIVCKGDTIFAGTGKALTAFSAKDGRIIWRNQEWTQREGTTSTLSTDGRVLIGSAQWSALHANDARTGRQLWSRSDNGLRNRGASPALHNGLLYLTSQNSFFILDAQTGRTIVRKTLPYNVDATSTPLLTDREIIFGTADRGLMALDCETLEERWNVPTRPSLIYTVPYTRPQAATIETSPVWAGDMIFAAASDGTLYAVNRTTGQVVWSHTTGAPLLNTPALSGQTLIVSDFGGNVYAFTSAPAK